MYGRSRTNVKAELRPTLMFSRVLYFIYRSKNYATLERWIYAQPLIHCVYFIYARKFYARIHVKNTREWKSTLKELKEYILAVEMRERIGKRY